MNLDELQSVRDRERQTDQLQQLRESFYEEAGEFIRALHADREEAAAEAANPYDDPTVTRLTDDISTAEATVKAIYEQRVGKLVKAASFAAADLPTDADGMTTEERDLFETLVASIKANRGRVLDVLATGGGTAGTNRAEEQKTETPPPSGESTVPAAEVMGTSVQEDPDGTAGPPSAEADAGDDGPEPGESDAPDADGHDSPDNSPEQPPQRESDGATDTPTTTEPSGVDVDRRTVRITDALDTFVGVDGREYDLAAGDVARLPATNVDPLVAQNVATLLEEAPAAAKDGGGPDPDARDPETPSDPDARDPETPSDPPDSSG